MDNSIKSESFKPSFIPFYKLDRWVNEDRFSNHPYVKTLKDSLRKNNEELSNFQYNVFHTNSDTLNKMLTRNSDEDTGLRYNYPYLLEIFGKSSMGKTQIMIQLLLSVLLPVNLIGGEALYISTEDSTKIIYRRFKQMFDKTFCGDKKDAWEHNLLDRIKFLYSRNLINFVEYQLEKLLIEGPYIRYLFIDSISNDLRHINDNVLKYRLFEKISKLSFKYKVMVFLTNQVFTFIDDEEKDEENREKKDKWQSRGREYQADEQVIPCMKYESQLKYITNPLFFNKNSLGTDADQFDTNSRFEVPTMGYLFNNFVNTRIGLFHMGPRGDRFLRVLYSDSWNTLSQSEDTLETQLRYVFERNGLVVFEQE
ncbi:hypothetical protein QEN19_003580 [Hanseniaspora menglaensis]